MIRLLQVIERHHRRFRRPPIGPIGAHVVSLDTKPITYPNLLRTSSCYFILFFSLAAVNLKKILCIAFSHHYIRISIVYKIIIEWGNVPMISKLIVLAIVDDCLPKFISESNNARECIP